LINWYGVIGTNGDVGVLLENSNAMVDLAQNMNMNFSVIMEDRFVGSENGLNPVDYVHINIEYLKNNYFNKSKFIRDASNKPFFGIFGPININDEASWTYALTAAGEDVTFLPLYWDKYKVGQNAAGAYDWVIASGKSGIESFYQNTAPTLDFVMGCAYPGFEDFYSEGGWGSSYFTLDPNNGSLLNETLQLSKDNINNMDALQLVTWNDFGEGTNFEPTFEYGFDRLTAIQSKFGVAYSEFELQNIYRLYTFRKTHKNDQMIQDNLDQASLYFQNDNPTDAITILDNIESANNTKQFLIKNRSNNLYLYQNGGTVKYANLQDNDSFKWNFKTAGEGYFFIENAGTQHRINIETLSGTIECNPSPDTHWSAMWHKATVNGTHLRLQNRWITNQFINTASNTGTAEHSTHDRTVESSQWLLEETSSSLNIQDPRKIDLTIYPNPSSNHINIETKNHIDEIIIFDAKGQIIKTISEVDKPSLKIEVKNWTKGIYLLKIKSNKIVKTSKIVVE
jgi:hypothetical protein